MTRILSNTRDLTHWIVMLAVGAVVFLAGLHFAHAAVGPGDPVATAQASADGGVSLLTTAGPVIGGMYLAYAIASALLARYRSSNWLAQGKRLAWATSVLGVAGAALQSLATDGTWSVVLMAAAAAAFKLLSPTLGATAVARSSSAAKLAVVALFVLAACTAAQRTEIKHGATAGLVNCTAQTVGTAPGLDLATLVAIANTVAAERAHCMTPSGISWQCVGADAAAKGVTLGGCAFVELVQVAAKAIRPSGSGLVAADPAPPPGAAELEHFRREWAAGATFHTAIGDR